MRKTNPSIVLKNLITNYSKKAVTKDRIELMSSNLELSEEVKPITQYRWSWSIQK